MKTSILSWFVAALGVLALTVGPAMGQYPGPGYGPAPYPGMMPAGPPAMVPQGAMGAAPAHFVGPSYSLQDVAPVSHLAGASCDECGHEKCAGECSSCYEC